MFTFESAEDVKNYISYLDENGLLYHLDDDASEIIFVEALVDFSVEELVAEQKALWEFCNANNIDPFEFYPNLHEED